MRPTTWNIFFSQNIKNLRSIVSPERDGKFMQISSTTNMLQIWWIFRCKRDTCLSAPIFFYPVAYAFIHGFCS